MMVRPGGRTIMSRLDERIWWFQEFLQQWQLIVSLKLIRIGS